MSVVVQEKFFHEAAKVAGKALCLRDKCGAVIVVGDRVIASGYNAPPGDDVANRKCEIDLPTSGRKKAKSDCTCCIHAEWRAIADAQKTGEDLSSAVLYFTRVDADSRILYSGEPYCTVCSRLALDAGIGYWALWHEDGVKLYGAQEYNDLSYNFHK